MFELIIISEQTFVNTFFKKIEQIFANKRLQPGKHLIYCICHK